VLGAGATGSARGLVAGLVGTDVVKNEITCHAVATLSVLPEAQTIIEIGGQDSKLIIVQNGVMSDFALNNICAAGTGSFLDHQAARMGITTEEMGNLAASSKPGLRISGRCTVLAETDVIQKQQMGYAKGEICVGLCDALVDGYLSNVARGKLLRQPIVFQGGVAANIGMRLAFSRRLGCQVVVPDNFAIQGAIGVAMLAKRLSKQKTSRFKGFVVPKSLTRGRSFVCKGCENRCEIVELQSNGKLAAYLGSRCGKWAISSV